MIRTMRGMDSLRSGQHFIDAWVIQYNHMRKHSALKMKRPAEAAQVDVPYKKWADIVLADIEVPVSCRKKAVKRGTPKVPVKYIERAKALAEKKKKTRKGKGRVRAPQVVYPSESKRQRRLEAIVLDEATKAKLKPAAMMPRARPIQHGLLPVADISKVKAPKPAHPQMGQVKSKKPQQFSLLANTVPRFIRKPQPAGAKR